MLDGWSHRNDENVHFMFFENCKMNMEKSLKDLASFLESPLKDEDLPKLMSHLKFENIKKNESVNARYTPVITENQAFVRRGEIGGNPEMTIKLSKKIDEWTNKNLIGSDFVFPFL